MVIEYGNIVHILSILFPILILVFLGLILRNKPDKAKKVVILVILFLNLFQHIFKCIVWPHYWGTGFNQLNSAYNMCALLIIISPLVFLIKWKALKDFMFYIGTTAGLIAISVPYWFIGQTILTFEYLRFYTCHLFLFLGSSLPVFTGLHRISLRNTWKIGFIALFALLTVLGNNYVFLLAESNWDYAVAFDALLKTNPVWCMRPPEGFDAVVNIIKIFTPKVFLGDGDKPYTPIMWYAIPMYSLITILCFLVCLLFSRYYKNRDESYYNHL